MLISENAVNMLAAKTYKGIGRKWINDNLRGGMTEQQIVDLLDAKGIAESVRGFALTKMSVRAKIESLGSSVDGVVGLEILKRTSVIFADGKVWIPIKGH